MSKHAFLSVSSSHRWLNCPFCSDPQMMIEQRLDFSRWVPDGFGTYDCVIVADEELQIIDYKHGVGVLIDAVDNSQMMCYALEPV